MSETETAPAPDRTAIRKDLRKRHRALERAEIRAREARDSLYVAAAQANAQGVTLEEIGEALGGLSKQRVSDVVRAVRRA